MFSFFLFLLFVCVIVSVFKFLQDVRLSKPLQKYYYERLQKFCENQEDNKEEDEKRGD